MRLVNSIALAAVAHRRSVTDGFPKLKEAVGQFREEEHRYLLGQKSVSAKRYRFITEKLLKGDSAAVSVLDMALAQMIYPEFGKALKQATGYGVTVKNGWLSCGDENPSYKRMQKSYHLLCRIFYMDRGVFPFYDAEFYVDNGLLGYLCGKDAYGKENFCLVVPGMQEDYLPRHPDEQLTELLHDRVCLQFISENEENGRLLLLSAAKQAGVPLLFCGVKGKKNDKLLFEIKRVCLLEEAYVCWNKISGSDSRDFYDGYVQPFLDEGIPVCLCMEEKMDFTASFDRQLAVYSPEKFDRKSRIVLWEELSAFYGISVDALELGTKYALTIPQMKQVFLQLRRRKAKNLSCSTHEVIRLCRQMNQNSVQFGELLAPPEHMTLEDIILAQEQKDMLQKICNHIIYENQVYEKWHMDEKYLYGKGVSAIFSGPPGTGKTMAAYVISNMLDMPIYHVDLSQIADKYIGETEKHLNVIFNYAQEHRTILFFDEADAVFGKRSEVKEAKDRYANTEISYILQRVEKFDGVVILATNLKNNIDPAFTRRMKYMVDFHMPGREERLQIWKKGFSDSMEQENIDFEYLARSFELAGGDIKNIILIASFAAAGDGEPVQMKHILQAVKQEYQKHGKIMAKEEFGSYGYLM